MRYRKLAPDGDYSFGNGQQDFYRDVPEAVGQAAKTRLLLWLGEWFLDIEEGTPFMQGILGKYSVQDANVTIQDRAINTQGMVDIKNYVSTFEPDSRGLSAQFDIDTIYGPTAVQVANYANY
jgi:hypothetical protein